MIAREGFIQAKDTLCQVCLRNHVQSCGLQYFLHKHEADTEMLILHCKESKAERLDILQQVMKDILKRYSVDEIVGIINEYV